MKASKKQSVAVKSGLPVEWTKTTRICGTQPHVELWGRHSMRDHGNQAKEIISRFTAP
jgi:hypothetical protein